MAENNSGTGMLIVQVYTADQALPLADANVLITKNSGSGEELVRVLKTDRSGRTQPISLAAPPAANSLDPENGGARFFNYNIRVDYPGYYTMENLNVPIFEGQTSIQPVAMIPLPADEERGKKITVVEDEPRDLDA
ncbi:MAG: hypothetical protein IKW64_04430 [Clostridia bacterium]|nr:hypothetical protein [Clostridia bacterium]